MTETDAAELPFIRLTEVTKSYVKGAHRVTPLVEVTIDVHPAEFFVLLGPSGSGKTTLLNLLAGIDRQDSGTVRVAGQDLETLSPRRLARWRAEHVGYVFQHCHLIPVLTAYENIELPLHLLGLSSRDRQERTLLALEAVGLADRAEHFPRQLSGGQEQRVAIARALVADPPLIVADEPTGDLDRESADATMLLLQRLNKERGKTIVMVTHDRHAASYGTRVMLLDKGKLRADGVGG